MKYFAWIGGGLLVLLGLLLPVQGLLDWGSRFSTVAGFRADYEKGLQVLRVALVLNGLLAAALYALAAALMVPGMTSSFQQDEWRCLNQYIEHGPLIILTRSPNADNHLLYSLLAWPCVKILGSTEVALRLPALLLTPLAPAFLFAILRRRHAVWFSILGALPMAGSLALLYYGAEGRGYGPMISSLLGLAWLQPRMLHGTMRDGFAYVAVGVAAVLFHIFAAPAAIAIAVAGAVSDRARTALLRNGASLAWIGALSLLGFAMILPQQFGYSETARPEIYPSAPFASFLAWGFVGTASPLWAVPFAFALLFSLQRHEAVIAPLVTALLLAGVIAFSHAGHSSRFYLPVTALLWISIGHGLASVFRCKPGGAITLLALLVATVVADAREHRLGKRDFRRAAAELSSRLRPGERVMLFHDTRPVLLYLKRPITVALRDEDVMSARPEWFLIVDLNLGMRPDLESWLNREYALEFRLPSTGGEVRGYRLMASER